MGNLNESSEQVDFDSLLIDLDYLIQLAEIDTDSLSIGEVEGFKESYNNLKTFFDMLAKSSTFAHLAHKELKRRKENQNG